MTDDLFTQYPYITLAASSFLLNIAFGYMRENHPKFSFKWFLWVHASIPFIIYLRLSLSIPGSFVPTGIFIAILGQILGGLIRKKRMNNSEYETLNQIPALDKDPSGIIDSDVMVTLLNMGGPKTNNDVKDFQKRLFNDSLLIRFPLSWALQKLFANLLIFFRLKAVKERYQEIGGGSPIYPSTERQTEALQKELDKRGRNVHVNYSFNYSPPLPDETIAEIKGEGKKFILPLSLYPHYSKATTGSNIHYLKQSAQVIFPELQFMNPPSYYLDDNYIQAFVDRINETVKPGESLDDFYLLFSAHGLPLYFLSEGDVYPFQIAQTVAKVVDKLSRQSDWSICYQSEVGPLQWLKPSTEGMLEALAKRKIGKIIVVPISFVTDHIETIHEIDIEYREVAEDLGIHDFRMSKAIECHPGFITALADAVERSLPEIPNESKLKENEAQSAQV